MRARPAHTLTAVVTLAIGIGANVAMFAVVDGVLLAPLDYRDADQLVAVAETKQGQDPVNMGYLSFVDLKSQARSVSHLVAATQSTATFSGGGQDAERVNAMRVSRGYFDMIGVQPMLGRAFTDAEDMPGAARRVVILSDGLWRRRFAADPGVIGRPVVISDIPHVIVGVMPRGFDDIVASRFYKDAGLWFPLGYDPAASFACRTCRHLRVLGRLAPGVTPAAAEAELTQLFARMADAEPGAYTSPGARVTRLRDVFLGPVRPALLLLWGGVAVLLLVACANVASLLLLRASERRDGSGRAGGLGRDPSPAGAPAPHRVGAALGGGRAARPAAGVGGGAADRHRRTPGVAAPGRAVARCPRGDRGGAAGDGQRCALRPGAAAAADPSRRRRRAARGRTANWRCGHVAGPRRAGGRERGDGRGAARRLWGAGAQRHPAARRRARLHVPTAS